MNIVILGASGFLGSLLYCKALNKGWTVTGTRFQYAANSRLVQIDLTDERQTSDFFESIDADAVIWSVMSKSKENSRFESGLLNLLKRIGPSTKLIFMSSDGVFAGGKGNYRETDTPEPLSSVNPLAEYTNAKINSERLIRQVHPNHVIIRSGPIYGQDANGKWDHRTNTVMNQLKSGLTLHRATNIYKTFVHADDLAEALLELCSNSFHGNLHLGPENKQNYYTFCRSIAHDHVLNPDQIIEYAVSESEAEQQGIPLDTSLNTALSRSVITGSFRSIELSFRSEA